MNEMMEENQTPTKQNHPRVQKRTNIWISQNDKREEARYGQKECKNTNRIEMCNGTRAKSRPQQKEAQDLEPSLQVKEEKRTRWVQEIRRKTLRKTEQEKKKKD